MALSFKCPKCGASLEAGENEAGGEVMCGACFARVSVPAPQPSEPRRVEASRKEQHAPSETLVVRCTCGKELKVPAKYAGTRGKCAACGAVLRVPAASPKPTPVSAEAPSGFITFRCQCGKEHRVEAKHAGETGKCSHCGKAMQVPNPLRPEPKSEPEPGQAAGGLVSFRCKCGEVYQADPKHAGEPAVCPSCGRAIAVSRVQEHDAPPRTQPAEPGPEVKTDEAASAESPSGTSPQSGVDASGPKAAGVAHRLPRPPKAPPAGTEPYVQVLRGEKIIKYASLKDLRDRLLAGKLNRHTLSRWVEPRPEKTVAADAEDWEKEALEFEHAEKLEKWEQRRKWRPIGEGLAKEEGKIMGIYNPLSMHSTNGWGIAAVISIAVLMIPCVNLSCHFAPAIDAEKSVKKVVGPIVSGKGDVHENSWKSTTAFWGVILRIGLSIAVVFLGIAAACIGGALVAGVTGAPIGALVYYVRRPWLPPPPDDGYIPPGEANAGSPSGTSSAASPPPSPKRQMAIAALSAIAILPIGVGGALGLGVLAKTISEAHSRPSAPKATRPRPKAQSVREATREWVTYSDRKAGLFSCRYPRGWRVRELDDSQSRRVQFLGEEAEIRVRVVLAQGIDVPSATVTETLKRNSQRVFPAGKGTLISDRTLRVAGRPAYQMDYSQNRPKARCRAIMLYSDRRLHIIMFASPADSLFDKWSDEFCAFTQSYAVPDAAVAKDSPDKGDSPVQDAKAIGAKETDKRPQEQPKPQAPEPPQAWATYTDPKGRFVCSVPPGWRTDEAKQDRRSKVRFLRGAGEIGIITRDTRRHILDESDRQEMISVQQRIKRKVAAMRGEMRLLGVEWATVGSVKALKVETEFIRPESFWARQMKFKRDGWDHTITLFVRSPDQRKRLGSLFDEFLDRYRSPGK